MTNPVGRPTKYNDALQAEADRYLMDWADFDVVPSRVGLCCFLGISKQTSFTFEKEYPNFLATLQAVEAMQERTALNGGLSGGFNSTITKLVLANHGYHDKSAVDNTSSDNSMSPKGSTLDMSKLSTEALAEIMRAADEPKAN